MNHLKVDTDEAFATSHSVSNDAEDLCEEWAGLKREWDKLSRGWTGAASSAYSALWAEWVEGANALVDTLADSSHRLGVAAVRYSAQDDGSATALNSAPIDLGL